MEQPLYIIIIQDGDTQEISVKMGHLEIIFLLKTISIQMDFVVNIYFC